MDHNSGDQQQQQQQQEQPPVDQQNMGQEAQQQAANVAEPVLEDAPMGSDDEDIVYADEEEMQRLEDMADEEEANALAEAQDGFNDFETFQEDEFAEGEEYGEGEVLQLTAERNDSLAHFDDHHDSVYAIDSLPVAPFNLIASGDGDDKAFVWRIVKNNEQQQQVDAEVQPEAQEESKNEEAKEVAMDETGDAPEVVEQPKQPSPYSVELVCELAGHTETVEFCKFDSSGKWLVTGGMNNVLRVWDVENGFALKKTIDNIPKEDLNFVEWHASAPVLMTGGKDYMIWLVNAVNGKIMANLIGHEDEVLKAHFSMDDRGKHIVSSSADKSIRVWSPLNQECIQTIRSFGTGSRKEFHESQILCFALHPDQPVILSGDEDGRVFVSQYMTGEINGVIGKHEDSCESIAISRTQPMACSAGIDKNIHVYDLTNFTRRLTVTIDQLCGFTILSFSKIHQNCLVAASTMGDISIIDPRNGAVVKTIKGHCASINDIKEFKLEDGTPLIVTAGDDNHCLVFSAAADQQ